MRNRNFTISNTAGGYARNFRLDLNGRLSARAINHARYIGFGGPVFSGPAAEAAKAAWADVQDEILDGRHD